MTSGRLVAIFDAGKTHLKLSVVDPPTLEVLHFRSCDTPWIPAAPYSHLNHEAAEVFLIDALRDCPLRHRIGTVLPIGHGAAAALLCNDGTLAAPILDYEDPAISSVDALYVPRRDRFAETLSPDLPLGLNLGRQLLFLKTLHGALYDRAASIVPYPQYWALRMCGVAASEVTSLGCHSDLWHPRTSQFSRFAASEGFAALFAPLRKAGDCLGTITPAFALRTGLTSDVRVHCGIHDSNAAYLGHLIASEDSVPTVISSGTWVVIMAKSADPAHLIADRDHLANVDALGGIVPTARFMGGREYEVIAGVHSPAPAIATLDALIEEDVLALPSFASSGGPFCDSNGSIRSARNLSPIERATLATLYVALVTDQCLSDLGAKGDIVVEGVLTQNPLYGSILAALRVGQRVLLADGEAASRRAACSLCGETTAAGLALSVAVPVSSDVAAYRSIWQHAIQAAPDQS